MVVAKRCGKCNREVPIAAQAGQNCPFCGAYWGSEQTNYVPGGGGGYESPGYFPMPRNSMERMACYEAMVYQKLIERQMALDQMARQERERRRQEHVSRCKTLREEELAKRDATYQQAAEATERFRQEDDPEQRAERYLSAAARAEAEQSRKAAIGYYRLVVRSLPGTPAAEQAADALARLAAK
jgi:hypothetical protein